MRFRVGRVAVALTILGVIVVPPSPAAACSCAPIDPVFGLDQFPAAFVGTFVYKTDIDDREALYVFDVEEWVKGNLGDRVGVRAPRDGGGCGYEFQPGQRMASFLELQGGETIGGLCFTADPDELLRAAAEPIVFDGTGPPRLLVGGTFADGTLAVLDAEGGLLDVIGDAETGEGSGVVGWPQSFHPCPGGKLLVELWWRQLLVRDLATLEVVSTIDLRDVTDFYQVIDAKCRDEQAGSIWLRASWMGGRYEHVVIEVLPEPTTLLLEWYYRIDLGQTGVVQIRRGDGGREVWLLDLAGDGRSLYRIEGIGANDARVDAAERPGGGVVVVLDVRGLQSGESPTSTLTLHDTSGTEIARRTIDEEAARVKWIDDKRLLVWFSDESGGSRADVVDAASLNRIVSLDGWQTGVVVADGAQLYGLDRGRLLRANLESGTVEELRVFGVNTVGAIALSAREPGSPEPTPVTAPRATVGEVAKPGDVAAEEAPAIFSWIVIGVVVAVGAAALTGAVVGSRRR